MTDPTMVAPVTFVAASATSTKVAFAFLPSWFGLQKSKKPVKSLSPALLRTTCPQFSMLSASPTPNQLTLLTAVHSCRSLIMKILLETKKLALCLTSALSGTKATSNFSLMMAVKNINSITWSMTLLKNRMSPIKNPS